MCHTPRGCILRGIMILKGLHSIATDSNPPPPNTHTFICFVCLRFQLLSTLVLSSCKHLQTMFFKRMSQCNQSMPTQLLKWLFQSFSTDVVKKNIDVGILYEDIIPLITPWTHTGMQYFSYIDQAILLSPVLLCWAYFVADYIPTVCVFVL